MNPTLRTHWRGWLCVLLVNLGGLALVCLSPGCVQVARPNPVPSAPVDVLAEKGTQLHRKLFADLLEQVAKEIEAGEIKTSAEQKAKLAEGWVKANEQAWEPLETKLTAGYTRENKWDAKAAASDLRKAAAGIRRAGK